MGENIYENTKRKEEERNLYQNVGARKLPGKPKPEKRPKPGLKAYRFLVSIDIGQSTMGYGIAPADKPRQMAHLKNWAANYGYNAQKCPTAVFVNVGKPEIGFNAFETFCNRYGSDYEADDMALAQRFSRSAKGSKNEDHRIKLFNKTMNELFELALSAVKDTYKVNNVGKKDVKLILVMDQQLKTPTGKKGLIPKQTQELLEKWNPENTALGKMDAAFLHCRLDIKDKFATQKILLINAGGSDIQLAVYQALSDGKYTKSCLNRTGFGSNRINKYFVKFMSSLFDVSFVGTCKRMAPVAWLELMKSFEQCKKGASQESSTSYTLQLSSLFGEIFKQVHGTTIAEHLKGNKALTVTRDWKLKLSGKAMKVFYDNVTTEIEKEIKKMKNIMSCEPGIIYLVGGFSESEYMHKTIRRLFPEVVTMVKPESADVCALKGGILSEEGSVQIKGK